MNKIMKGINELLIDLSRDLLDNGYVEFNNRTNSEITYLVNPKIIGKPTQRFITLNSRKNNLCAQVMEMMMVISGNPDLSYLSLFLPRAIDYSDDGGKTWRGNYGIRLRGNKVFNSKLCNNDQFKDFDKDNLEKVINTIKTDPSSRQLTVTIHNSNVDRFIETKDTPCTMDLIFGVHDNKLDLRVDMRSNDMIFGFSGVNYFIFTSIQELVSEITGYPLGKYYHCPFNFHVYENKYSTLNNIASETIIEEIELEKGLFKGIRSLKEFDNIAEVYFKSITNSNLGIDGFDDAIRRVTPNHNLIALLDCTYAYVHGSRWTNLSKLIAMSDIINTNLLERDIFFRRHVSMG